MVKPTHLCPGSGQLVSSIREMAPGSHTCAVCGRFVPMTNDAPGTRLRPHSRDVDRHTRRTDDGAEYCGYATDIGVIDGCGHVWPCPAVLSREVNPHYA